jgi:hypothetical protein
MLEIAAAGSPNGHVADSWFAAMEADARQQ